MKKGLRAIRIFIASSNFRSASGPGFFCGTSRSAREGDTAYVLARAPAIGYATVCIKKEPRDVIVGFLCLLEVNFPILSP